MADGDGFQLAEMASETEDEVLIGFATEAMAHM